MRERERQRRPGARSMCGWERRAEANFASNSGARRHLGVMTIPWLFPRVVSDVRPNFDSLQGPIRFSQKTPKSTIEPSVCPIVMSLTMLPHRQRPETKGSAESPVCGQQSPTVQSAAVGNDSDKRQSLCLEVVRSRCCQSAGHHCLRSQE